MVGLALTAAETTGGEGDGQVHRQVLYSVLRTVNSLLPSVVGILYGVEKERVRDCNLCTACLSRLVDAKLPKLAWTPGITRPC